MSLQTPSERKPPSDVPTRQTVRSLAQFAALGWLLYASTALAQIYDSLDVHPPRWYLDTSDCEARVTSQGHLADGGISGGACESITFVAKHGTEALLVYPIEPVRPLDALTANVSVMSARRGASIGLRVRYPYLRDQETHRPVSVVVYGASYQSPGEFASIGIGAIERPLRMKNVTLRGEYGSTADLSDPYVDAIVINAYSGPGTGSLRMDELRVDGLIPVGDDIVSGNLSSGDARKSALLRRVADDRPSGSQPSATRHLSAFPLGKVTRILQHNGEPLSWVRSLGFDAVLLSGPPDAAILSEAIRARMLLYAPPPSSPDPSLQPLLEPVAGWYVGSGEALDSRQVDQTSITSQRLRAWPSLWQRPLVGAPSETWRSYAPLLDAIIDDLPPRVRGIRGGEEVAQMTDNSATSRRPGRNRRGNLEHAGRINGRSDRSDR